MSAEMIYGRQTEHSIENFPSQGRTLGDLPPFVRNYALVKHAAAIANNKVSRLDDARRDAITTACTEIAAGQYSDQFPSALLHGGGGIATNMNINEVIANRASVLGNVAVHPNDHVNASQSTNETYQAAMALTLLDLVENPLVAMEELASVLDDKAREFRDVQHLGRTCLQDAVTISANLTHRAQAAGVRRPANSLRIAVDQVSEVPIGGTVIGTGIGSSAEFSAICVSELARLSGRKLMAAENFADSVANFDPYGAISGACVRSAIAVGKIASDIRLLASGPRGGFGDIAIPAVQAGSSIMPAKVNPVIPEYAMQLAFRIRGCGHTVG